MPINAEQAEHVIEALDDRDRAPFFAGRADQPRSFARAVKIAQGKDATVFRVFHGAPGSGKTSLLHHIRDTLGDDPKLLFVKGDDYMTDKATLVSHIADTAMRRPFGRAGDLVNDVKGSFAGHMTTGAMAASDAVRMKTASEALAKWRRAHALGDDFTVVLTFDEAQVLEPSESKVLRSLHKAGIEGVRSVILLAGLSHTDRALSEANISRRADEGSVEMGALALDECMEANHKLLDRIEIEDCPARNRLSREVARMSHGWPQHLNRAQQAMARELHRVDGDIRRVDAGRIGRESDAARARYYADRVASSTLTDEPALTYRIIQAIAERPVANRTELARLCRKEMGRAGLLEDPDYPHTPIVVASALEEKGIACETADRGYVIPIPSMVRWAESRMHAARPR